MAADMPGGVLVDVEGPIEVGNAEALEGELVVECEVGAEVLFEQLAIDRLEAFDGERFALPRPRRG
jgi:hypothetical protein